MFWVKFPVLFLLYFIPRTKGESVTELSSNVCYGVDLPCTSHQLRCPDSAIITIINAYYGYKYRCGVAEECTACCWYKENDCLVEYESEHYQSLFQNCSLQTRCSFHAPWISHAVCSDLHRKLVTSVFSFITYKCVDVHHVVSVNEGQQTSGTNINIQSTSNDGSTVSIYEKTSAKYQLTAENTGNHNVLQGHAPEAGVNVTTIVTCSFLAMVIFVAVLGLLIKFNYCKRLVALHQGHNRKPAHTDMANDKYDTSDRVYYECEPSRYSVINIIQQSVYTVTNIRAETLNNPTSDNTSLYGDGYDRLQSTPRKHLGQPDPNYDQIQIKESGGADHVGNTDVPIHVYSVVNKTTKGNATLKNSEKNTDKSFWRADHVRNTEVPIYSVVNKTKKGFNESNTLLKS